MAQAERLSAWQALQQRTKHGDAVFWLLTLFFALLVIALVFAVGYVVWIGSSEARARFGFSFLFQSGWDPNAGNFGALPAIYGTVVSSGIALLLAGPLGILIGVFLSELCPDTLRSPLSFLDRAARRDPKRDLRDVGRVCVCAVLPQRRGLADIQEHRQERTAVRRPGRGRARADGRGDHPGDHDPADDRGDHARCAEGGAEPPARSHAGGRRDTLGDDPQGGAALLRAPALSAG